MIMARAAIAFAVAIAFATASADEQKAAARAVSPEASKPLDLRAPDIFDIFTPQQITLVLARTFDRNIEGIEVEGERVIERSATPRVWWGLGAPFWALANPTQAWRIFAPLPPDQIKMLNFDAPRATDTFMEPAAPTFP
jgi:hypothetical protein